MDTDQGYYIVIPTILLENSHPNKAILYGLITSYARKSGICYASNEMLAKKIKMGPRQVQRYINELVKEGWLISEIVPSEGNKRYLQITPPNLQVTSPDVVRWGHARPQGGDTHVHRVGTSMTPGWGHARPQGGDTHVHSYNKDKRKIKEYIGTSDIQRPITKRKTTVEEVTFEDKMVIVRKLYVERRYVDDILIQIEAWDKYDQIKDILLTAQKWLSARITKGEIQTYPPLRKVMEDNGVIFD